ncbi:dihydroneopterin aldolase [Flectobacillus major]|jgi:dihydroneopterin aldolase|uniref:dihydroneopterin aldolase n=1 Tax=Flectobacillus major TaxID=103 RepID=UPI0004030CDF|nr:dihydroneopterin aldolase [Flectobacillus major]
MGTISLEGLEFFAYHGFYEEERKMGNRYQIDIQITTDFSEAAEKDQLKATVNYVDLYNIIAEVMKIKAKLLEHIGQLIIEKVREVYPNIDEVQVTVSKFNPPIGGVCTRAKVTLQG